MVSVTMYGLPAQACVGCRASEISFRRKGIEVTKIRLDQDPSAMARVKALGYESAPVVVVERDGQVVDSWSGFSEDRIQGLKGVS